MIVPLALLAAAYAAAVLLLRPLAGRRALWPFAEPLPFALLAAAALRLRERWEEIPERFPIHFGLDGRPDGWAPRTPGAVYAPLLMGAGIVLVIVLLRAAVGAGRRGALGAPDAGALRRQAGGSLLGVEALVAAILSTTSFLALGATLSVVLGVVVGGVALLAAGLVWSLAAASRRPPDAGGTGTGGWRAGGLVYRDAGDPDLWIPKRIGIGWTLNFGHPAAWWVLALLLLAPLAVLAAVWRFALTK